MRIGRLWALVFCLWGTPLSAAPLASENVPGPLKPWIPWVLHGQEQYGCPSLYSLENQ